MSYENENFAAVFFSHPTMSDIERKIDRLKNIDLNVILLGESGVGKTFAARIIHERSRCSKEPFESINCAAIPESLMESELFGYDKGAFTGALNEGKKGLFELAGTGTVFLDEIGELNLAMQSKILQTIQDKQFRRIGGVRKKAIRCRIIAATNQNLRESVTNRRFRKDLYYRLNGFSLTLPPLSDCRSNIVNLASFYLAFFNRKHNIKKQFSAEVVESFLDYSWPGNIRELQHIIESTVVMSDNEIIQISDLPTELRTVEDQPGSPQTFPERTLKEAREEAEKKLLAEVCRSSKSSYQIAKTLKISQTTAYRLMQKHGVVQTLREN